LYIPDDYDHLGAGFQSPIWQGFNSHAHFAKVVREHTGKIPSEIREKRTHALTEQDFPDKALL
jgi:hypothetical protein